MELLWYAILCFMFSMYILLDGFDFGAGVVHLFFAKDEESKRAIHQAIGPFWDANEVWLIAAGGVMFAAFPVLYASAFSGFYLPLMLVLWLLIFRALGLELREFVHHPMWHQLWDFLFGWSSLLLAFFYGLALGNVVRGVNLGGFEEGSSLYDSNYFFLPLWNDSFSPLVERLGVVDWFTLQLGLIALLALSLHGAAWIIFRTESPLNERLRRFIPAGALLLLVLSVTALFVWRQIRPEALKNYEAMPWLWIFPALMFLGLLGLIFIRRFTGAGKAFLFTSLFIGGGLFSTALSMYPVLLPSANAIHPDITIFNAGLDVSGMRVANAWFVVGISLVAAYFVLLFRVFRRRLKVGN